MTTPFPLKPRTVRASQTQTRSGSRLSKMTRKRPGFRVTGHHPERSTMMRGLPFRLSTGSLGVLGDAGLRPRAYSAGLGFKSLMAYQQFVRAGRRCRGADKSPWLLG